ncbi:unnamed protein product [Brassica oleracea var. botrytis]|uniref:Uncharacterized protein n=1 Tax=Brassica oleracea TaxID=3712 RepID=A0A3P6E4D1_BRAOL|nr:unnamed protein product [Brassica oleracea]
MTRSVIFFFTVSLLLFLAAVSAIASSGNMTSGFSYGGCVSGVTVVECITAAVEDEEGVEAVVRGILQQQRRKLSYKALQKQQSCNGKIAALEQLVTFDCCIVDCYVILLGKEKTKQFVCPVCGSATTSGGRLVLPIHYQITGNKLPACLHFSDLTISLLQITKEIRKRDYNQEL